MTERHTDEPIDLIADEIRGEEMDEATAKAITDRVWKRLGANRQTSSPLSSCEDFQAEIPAYVVGSLSEARQLLVGDHTRECVPCRRALMEARGSTSEVHSPASRRDLRWQKTAMRVAAALILVLGGIASIGLIGDFSANRGLRASVVDIDGSLQLVSRGATNELATDDEIRAGNVLRTARGSTALLRIADGSLIEIDERSELELRASRNRVTIDLGRGNIIVHAADQGDGQLFVATNDCEVAVKGTIFAVNHGLKGSRVSVIEGAVEVREGSSSALLRPGDQITTGDRLRRVPLEEEISWSRDAAKHKALLRELSELRRVIAETVDHAPPRTSTFLLDLAPGNTFVYAAMPNITGDLDEARTAFYEQLSTSTVLAEWWQEQVAAHGIDAEIDRMLDRLQPMGEAIGAEAVITVPVTVVRGDGLPLFVAELDDPEGFAGHLQDLIDEANAEVEDHTAAVLVDDPLTDAPIEAELYLWVDGNLFAAAGEFSALQTLAERVDDPSARTFIGTTLHDQLADTYAGGVSWLLGVNLASAIAEGTADISDQEAAAMDQLGLLDATTVVVERHRDGEWYATNAEIRFSNPRRGMMAWLAEPSPIGSLEFVSPDAYVVASAVTVDATRMFDDLLELVVAQEPDALLQIELIQDVIGIDLREDLAATIGGEATVALDGPMLPVPSWKLIVEVYQPDTLVHTIERAVELINIKLTAEGEPNLVFETSQERGRTFYTIKREGLDGRAVFAMIDGYLVAGPSGALIEQAISYRDSGVSIADSNAFKDLLPDNGFTDCSALVYRDLGSLVEAVPAEMLGELEFADALSDGLSRGLVCVFGETERIIASATGGSLVGLASTLGIAGASCAENIVIDETDNPEAVSSL
jgi:ferric-dicitrate binding protein FerR (iron transport regulator)